MSAPTLLVVAKAPVPGLAKTRLVPALGEIGAARLAAAALLDTLTVARRAAREHSARPVVALTGDLDRAERADELRAALGGLTVIGQRGTGLAERLVAAHLDAAGPAGAVFQIGMDTPQLRVDQLGAGLDALRPERAGISVGPAVDGGWWGLGLRRAGWARALTSVSMSTATTRRETLAALATEQPDIRAESLATLRDLDTIEDLTEVARACRTGHFTDAVAAVQNRHGAEAVTARTLSGVGR